MAYSVKITIDHEEIKQWALRYQGKPALIDASETDSDDVGLRIDFPGASDEALLTNAKPSTVITWGMFFAIFEDKHLAFIYEPEPHTQDLTLTYRFIDRNQVKE